MFPKFDHDGNVSCIFTRVDQLNKKNLILTPAYKQFYLTVYLWYFSFNSKKPNKKVNDTFIVLFLLWIGKPNIAHV